MSNLIEKIREKISLFECVARVWDFRISRLEFANLRKPDDACYDFYLLSLCRNKFTSKCVRANQFSDFHDAETIVAMF